jgi:hypothetical protein
LIEDLLSYCGLGLVGGLDGCEGLGGQLGLADAGEVSDDG